MALGLWRTSFGRWIWFILQSLKTSYWSSNSHSILCDMAGPISHVARFTTHYVKLQHENPMRRHWAVSTLWKDETETESLLIVTWPLRVYVWAIAFLQARSGRTCTNRTWVCEWLREGRCLKRCRMSGMWSDNKMGLIMIIIEAIGYLSMEWDIARTSRLSTHFIYEPVEIVGIRVGLTDAYSQIRCYWNWATVHWIFSTVNVEVA